MPAPDYGTFWFAAHKLVSVMERVADRRLRAELGVSETLFRVLSAVEIQDGDLNQQDVADKLGMTKATVSRQLESASEAGHLTISVSASSRRNNSVVLTAQGRKLVAKGDRIVAEETAKVLSGIDRADIDTTFRTVTTMLNKQGRQ